jgi:hypothetical protein
MIRKQPLILILILIPLFPTIAQDEPPTAAPAVKNFALQPDVAGGASNSVNLFTGDVALPLNLVSLPGRGGLDVNVSIAYSSNVQNTVGTWNLEAPTGILGLGWSMDIPKIVVDHKSTGAREDDTYYLIEGGIANRLVRTISGADGGGAFYVYETKTYQFWRIRYYYGAEKWEITKEDGVRYVYGDKNSGRSTLQYIVCWNNWIGNSALTTGQTQMPHIWNLSEIINLWNERVLFAYENVEQFVGSSSGKKHTEASYLKEITDVLGRKVQFFYQAKGPSYFMEPHTEKAEPDAYQEFYERKYLDHIDVLRETGEKFNSIHFAYANIDEGLNTAKMLLASVVQKNAMGKATPGLHFEYLTSGPTKGFLHRITYPSGGTLTYTYTPSSVKYSDRVHRAPLPAGYSAGEKQLWFGDDYVVVCWRQWGPNSTYATGPRTVKLTVYQWNGGWKEGLTVDIPNIESTEYQIYKSYKDFQVTIQQNFFAVLTRNSPGTNSYTLRRFVRSESDRGKWLSSSSSYDYGSGVPSLTSGENFIFVGSFQDDSTHPSFRWVYTGNDWQESTLNQTIGDHYYTANNNYFISQNRAGFDGVPEFNFHYLSEDRKWNSKQWSTSLRFSSSGESFWHASNSFAVAMASSNPEYIYRWDTSYTNFYKDDILGGFHDFSHVFLLDNSSIGIVQPNNGYALATAARFNGSTWSKIPNFDPFNRSNATFGQDNVVWSQNSSLYQRTYDANTMNWSNQNLLSSSGIPSAGVNSFSGGGNIYFRNTNGTWATSPGAGMAGGAKYYFGASNITFTKNGQISRTVATQPLYNDSRFRGPNVIISDYYESPSNTGISLHRVIHDDFVGSLIDYPVTLITLSDGTTNTYTSIGYNLTKSTVDASGTVAQYNEVTVIPGTSTACNSPCTTPATKPNGYTKTFFYNGLTYTELNVPSMTVDQRWTGLSYEVSNFDAAANLVSTTTTSYNTQSRDINNDQNIKVERAYYVRAGQVKSLIDGIETMTVNHHDPATGLLTQSILWDHNSKGITHRTTTSYKYFWEVYDPDRINNILSPVVQTRTDIVNVLSETKLNSQATTWQKVNNVWIPHKSYVWQRTGLPDFDFSALSEPSSGWIKVSEIEFDAVGNVTQTHTPGTQKAMIYGYNNNLAIAVVNNAAKSQIAYTSFESNDTGYFTYSGSPAGSVSTPGRTGMKYYNLSSGNIQRTGLPAGRYILSYWSNGSAATVGGTNYSLVNQVNEAAINGWTYHQVTFNLSSSNSTVTISGSVGIDELRLHPFTAEMVTTTYDPLVGKTSETDVNNQSVFYEYDEFNRAKLVRDQKGNIVGQHSYYLD